MDVAVLLFFAVVLAAVVWFVTAPLRRPEGAADEREDPRLADLEARKEAKYREIRDAELDRAAGKLTEADWRAPGRRAARRGGRDPQGSSTARGRRRRVPRLAPG